jgi:hypothetical protein
MRKSKYNVHTLCCPLQFIKLREGREEKGREVKGLRLYVDSNVESTI